MVAYPYELLSHNKEFHQKFQGVEKLTCYYHNVRWSCIVGTFTERQLLIKYSICGESHC